MTGKLSFCCCFKRLHRPPSHYHTRRRTHTPTHPPIHPTTKHTGCNLPTTTKEKIGGTITIVDQRNEIRRKKAKQPTYVDFFAAAAADNQTFFVRCARRTYILSSSKKKSSSVSVNILLIIIFNNF